MKKTVKVIATILSSVMLLGLVGCGGTDTSTKSEKKEEKKEMKLNEAYTIKKDNKEYTLTIEGIRFTDERNQFSEKQAEMVVFLDYSYENVDSADDVSVYDTNFKVMDDEGTMLDTYPVMDDTRLPKALPKGAKCQATATFAMPKKSKELKVKFYDNMFLQEDGEIIINTGL